MRTELSDKEKVFVKEYVKHGKASYAARIAGYSSSSPSALSVSANRLLKRERVRDAIEELGAEIAVRSKQVLTVTDVKEVVIDRNDLTNKAVETYNDAKKDKQHGVRIQALKFLAELHKLIEEKDNSHHYHNFVLELVSEPHLIDGRATNQETPRNRPAQIDSVIEDAETV